MGKLLSLMAMVMVMGASIASATPYVVDSGWQTFSFTTVGTPLLPSIEFTLTEPGTLTVTDYQFSGDQFSLYDSGDLLGVTSTPTILNPPHVEYDIDLALIDPYFSHGVYNLPIGDYEITGIAVLAPYNFGIGVSNGAWRVDETESPVPEPSTFLLLGAGLGGLALIRRKSRKQ
jgi:PEP-CTERM motif